MAEDAGRSRAAAHIDADFQERLRDLVHEHRRQEQRLLALHKGQLESFARNRELAEARYAQRMQHIGRAYERAAAAVDKRHNSLAGRIERLTKAGRDRQETERQALEDRRAMVERKAAVQFHALTERQHQAEQRDRMARARELKQFHEAHIDARHLQARRHAETREQRIEQHDRAIKRTQADNALRQALQNADEGRGRRLAR